MTNAILLLVWTPHRRYIVQRDDVHDIRLVSYPAEPLTTVSESRPWISAELGTLLDPSDQSTNTKWHALIVPLRRREIALFVTQVELLDTAPPIEPLPALLREHLRQPWATGVLNLDNDVIVQLDLRAIARTVLALNTHKH